MTEDREDGFRWYRMHVCRISNIMILLVKINLSYYLQINSVESTKDHEMFKKDMDGVFEDAGFMTYWKAQEL